MKPTLNLLDSKETGYKKWLAELKVTPGWLWPIYELFEEESEPSSWRDTSYWSIFTLFDEYKDQSLAYIFYLIPLAQDEDREKKARDMLFYYSILKPLSLEEIRQYFSELDISNTYETIDQFNEMYNRWYDRYREIIDKQTQEAAYIQQFQEALLKVTPIAFGPFTVNTVDLVLEVTYKGQPLSRENSLAFVDDITVNKNVPVFRYEDNTNTIYKVFQKPEYLRSVKDKAFVLEKPKEAQPYTLTFILWADMEKYTQKSFITGYMSIEESLVVISSIPRDRVEIDQVVEKFTSAFPLDVTKMSEESFTGSFNLYGPIKDGVVTNFAINEVALADMVSNFNLFYTFLHLEESVDSMGEKEKFGIVFSADLSTASRQESLNIYNPSYASASFISQINQKGSIITFNDKTNLRVDGGYEYITTRISKGRTMEDVERSINILTRLLVYYLYFVSDVDAVYKLFIPEKEKAKVSIKTREPRKTEGSNLSELYSVLSDYIGPGYPRDCQRTANKQPIIIRDLDAWKKRTIEYKGERIPRPYLIYPYGGNVALGCPHDDNPFITLKAPHNMKVLDPRVPYIPCCGTKPVETHPLYLKYYLGQNVEEKSRKAENVIVTLKPLKPFRLAELNPLMDRLYSSVTGEKTKFHRMGMPKSPYSIIHCLAYATNDKYMTGDDLVRLDIATNYRRELKNIRREVYKQELYEYTLSEINDLIDEDSTELDAQLYYRGLEELFNVNIYVFSHDDKQNLYLEVPRHKYFHTRFKREGDTVMLYHFPGKQYELISIPKYEADRIVEFQTTFDELTDTLHELITQTHSVYEINVYPAFRSDYKFDKLLYHTKNVFSQERLDTYLSDYTKIVGQFIDQSGKCRGFEFDVLINDKLVRGAIVTPPSQPQNISRRKFSNYQLTYEACKELFGSPTSAGYKDDKAIGLWYSFLGVPEALYVPILPIISTLPKGPDNPLKADAKNMIERYRRLKTLYSVIYQLIIWSYKLLNRQIGISVDEFMKIYTTVLDKRVDSIEYYKLLSPLRGSLKLPEKVDDIFVYSAERVDGLVEDDKFVLYSEKMRQGIWYKLSSYIKTHSTLMIEQSDKTMISSATIVPTILDIKIETSDFSHRRYNLILLDDDNFQQWRQNQTISVNSRFVYTVGVTDIFGENPYLYLHTDGRGFIVQNVFTTNKYRALAVAFNWYREKINTGYYTLPYKTDDGTLISFPHVVYGVKTDSTLVVIENNSENSDTYLELVSYGRQKYASLLPIV